MRLDIIERLLIIAKRSIMLSVDVKLNAACLISRSAIASAIASKGLTAIKLRENSFKNNAF